MSLRDQPMHAQPVDQVVDDRRDRLHGIPLALVLPGQRVAEVGDAAVLVQTDVDVPDERAVQLEGELGALPRPDVVAVGVGGDESLRRSRG